MEQFRRRCILAVAITFALAVSFVASSVHAQVVGMVTRYEKAITVNHAPDGPWDVYVTDMLLHPGAWPGPHTHPGPEFGMIVSGTGQRWDTGRGTANIPVGGAYFSAWNSIHEGGNPIASSDDVVQLSVHLLERGGAFSVPTPADQAPAAAPKAAPQFGVRLWQSKFALDKHPATPFTLMERYVEYAPGAVLPIKVTQVTMVTVTAGALTVTSKGTDTAYGVGKQWMSQPGDTITVSNRSGEPSAAFIVALI